jgi:hypothetical protein
MTLTLRSTRGVVLPMQQTTEEDGLLFAYAVHDGPGKSLNNKEEKHVHYFHIPRAGDNSEGCAQFAR